MKRREFLALLGTTAAWPVAARAQQRRKLWRIGFISGRAAPRSIESSVWGAFVEGMHELGHVEGQDFVMEWRFAEEDYSRFPVLAAELIQLKVDVIVLGTPAAVRPVQAETATIPIIMGIATDPVGNGFVKSLAHPGGNITGLASSIEDVTPKQLELLTTIVPNLSRIGILSNPKNPTHVSLLRTARAASQSAGLMMVGVEARNPEELDYAFVILRAERASGLIILADAFLYAQQFRIAHLCARTMLPSVSHQREFVEAGGLLSYGQPLRDYFRRAATYVDKIIKGANPADLPVEQPTRFYLSVNLKTAKAIGLNIPESFLLRADEVIEQ